MTYPYRKEIRPIMMLKGSQRRLIMMTTKGSPLFESAYFILRKDTDGRAPTQNEMLLEATRILEENALPKKKPSIKLRHLLVTLAAGFLLGALTLGAVWLSVT